MLNLIETPQLLLGEGTVWNAETNCLFFVDINGEKVYEKNLTTNILKSFDIGGTVGFVAIENSNNLICAKNKDLVRLNLQSGKITPLTNFTIDKKLRFNDGKCDAEGRLWVGTMVKNDDVCKDYQGSLLCIENGKITSKIADMTIPNGMDWYNSKFYHVDTPTKKILEYTQNKNKLICGKVAFDLTNEQGAPDGFCIDENGNIWVAMWGGNCVLCCDIKSGKVINKIDLPDKCVSCCTFGGENLDTLFITSATDENGKGGHLYSIKLPVKGRKVNCIKI